MVDTLRTWFILFALIFLVIMGTLRLCSQVQQNEVRKELILKVQSDTVQVPAKQFMQVTATIYWPSGQPTYDDTQIPKGYKQSEHHWIAISHDLRKTYRMGDTVIVAGISQKFDGLYVVHDLMHKRWTRRIDILTAKHEEYNLIFPAYIRKFTYQDIHPYGKPPNVSR